MSLVEGLCLLILVLILVLFFLWGLILYGVTKASYKKHRRETFEKNLLEGMMNSYSNSNKEDTTRKLKLLKKYIKKDPTVLWSSTVFFVKINRVVKLSDHKKFQNIFEYLEIAKVLESQLKNKDWYIKAKAIWLSYEFELEKNAQLIIPFRDDNHTLLRRESQIGLVSFIGWKSLVFFPYVTHPMSLWQQIRILEKLEETDDKLDLQYLEKALLSKNETIKELLVRIIKKFQLKEYKNYVIEQLFSNNIKLINIALQTLKSFEITQEELIAIKMRIPEINKEQYQLKVINTLQLITTY